METDGLDLEIDGDYLQAKGTSLGGDDGIAVAYALAILDEMCIRDRSMKCFAGRRSYVPWGRSMVWNTWIFRSTESH